MNVLLINSMVYKGGEEGQGGAESHMGDLKVALERKGHRVFMADRPEWAMMICGEHNIDVIYLMTVFPVLHNTFVEAIIGRYPIVWGLMDYWPFCRERMLLRDDQSQDCPAVNGKCDPKAMEPVSVDKPWHHCVGRNDIDLVNSAHMVVSLNDYSKEIYERHGLRIDAVTALGVDTEMFKPGKKSSGKPKIAITSAWPKYLTKGLHIVNAAIEDDLGLDINIVTGTTRENVAKYLADVDIFIFPSTYQETWGLCLNEAMAAGCACISSDVAGAKHQIKHEENGLLFANRDPVALRAAIDRLVEDSTLREKLGKAARKQSEERYNLDGVAERYEEAFGEAIRRYKG